MRVLCLHTAGLGELVAASLTSELSAQVRYADDSAVLVDTRSPVRDVAGVGYVKNSFLVLGSVPRTRDLRRCVEAIVRALPSWSLRRRGNPYRLMFSEDGSLVGIPRDTRDRLIAAVGAAAGGRFTPRGGGDEYWVLTRRDLPEVLFCQRIARAPRKTPPKGGLAADVAELIVHAAGRPGNRDVVLDPFAGTGALIAARVQTPFGEAICSDLGYADGTVQLAPELAPELAAASGVRQLSDDARDLVSLADDSVDVVITDPPWGEFEGSEAEALQLIDDAVASIGRVLRTDGRVVMLVARRLAESTQHSWRAGGLSMITTYDLLLNGHPATVLVGRRGGRS